ncbi:toxin-antitoxin system YwqK family antitoxin [Acetobacter thailandicus]|uniref:hypothetical protein n=1 Tax=Acetobacter thailandicus TaxID=1502842 RepID=UPI001BAD3C45|nr:hypothetical protein [Acetobacter thailandicus]MBS0959136.1 hypothetical protein [Acetobacter thailandicus]
MIFKEWFESQKILTKNDLMFNPEVNGLSGEYTTYGGEYELQLMRTDEEEEIPVNGIVYDCWDYNENNEIEVYKGYTNGYIDGQKVVFYRNKNIEKISVAYKGTAIGPVIHFYENGLIKKEKFYSFGYNILRIEYDKNKNIIEKIYNSGTFFEESLKKECPDLYEMFISKIEFFV